MKLEAHQILSFLPHRDPFLFVDNIEIHLSHDQNLKKNKGLLKRKDAEGIEVISHYQVDKSHPIFQGHFPGNPILPGVIQIEIVAQTSGFALFYSFNQNTKAHLKMGLLDVKNAKFRKPIIPNRTVIVKTKLVKNRGTFFKSEGRIYGGQDELFSEMEIMLSIEEIEK